MTISSRLSYLDILFLLCGSWMLYKVSLATWTRSKTTKLNGPSSSWLMGVIRELLSSNYGRQYEEWAKIYGPVFQIPLPLGGRWTVLTDAKAVAHFYSKQTFTYVNSEPSREEIASLIGKGILWAEGESHRRQRKTLTPAFSNAAIRSVTPIFYDSAYKLKTAWDALISESDEAIIDVQKWMNCISLDSIGIAGFGHDFGTLLGRHSTVAEVFDAFGSHPPSGILIFIVMICSPLLPLLMRIPNSRNRLVGKLHAAMHEVSEELIERSRKEHEGGGGSTDTSRSLIGSLLKAENQTSELSLSGDEVLAQMKGLILAGYETTSISLTWALIELARSPEKQDRLRAELSEFTAKDPTYEQLTSSLPYLDAVMHEVLRLHPPFPGTGRVAAHDDVIPLGVPITTASGERVDHITIGRGTELLVPITTINRSNDIWGPDAKKFMPERWLDNEAGLTPKAKEMQGFHHILSFSDGPRSCLGRGFAIVEFKSVLSVLVRNFVFAMRDGPKTKIENVMSILFRPRVAGEEGYATPMRVSRFEH